MKIAIIGANGKAGKVIMDEALDRGIHVKAVVRDRNRIQLPCVEVLEKDVFKLEIEDIKMCDAVVVALGFWTPETLPNHELALKHLCAILEKTPIRLLVVGGAGSLYTDETLTMRLMDTPDFPEEFKPLAAAMAKGLDFLKTQKNVEWTYLSPAADFSADGPRTGSYDLGTDRVLVNAQGRSTVSYRDAAVAIVDELEQPRHRHQRFTIVAE